MAANAVTDFSLASNPNGVWSYLAAGATTEILLTQPVASNPAVSGLSYWSNANQSPNAAIIGRNITGSTQTFGTVTVPTDHLEMDPQSLPNVDVRFIAATTATYTIKGDFVGLDSSETGHVVQVLDNGVQVYQGFVVSNTSSSFFNLTQALTAGDIIDFISNTGPLSTHLSTGLAATVAVACFCAGTRIATTRGDIAVENLVPGDQAITAAGAPEAVTWIGHRTLAPSRHPTPDDVHPIRVQAGALASGVPSRDLYLSPDHAVFFAPTSTNPGAEDHGVLVPVRYLVNGASIARDTTRASVTYFHVELERHAILLAEGAPAESYLDTGNRAAFANAEGAVMMTPDFALRVWDTASCAPLLVAGPRLADIRRNLLDIAGRLGHVAATDPTLQATSGGQNLRLDRTGNRIAIRLPATGGDLRLACASAIPAELCAEGTDTRRLGIAIADLTVDGTPVPLTNAICHEGFHPAEPAWRWTDGQATLRLPTARQVEFTIVMTAPSWQTEAPQQTVQAA